MNIPILKEISSKQTNFKTVFIVTCVGITLARAQYLVGSELVIQPDLIFDTNDAKFDHSLFLNEILNEIHVPNLDLIRQVLIKLCRVYRVPESDVHK